MRIGRAVALAVGVVVMTVMPMAGTANAAAAPGCYSSQVGLYNQFNHKGHCYGFAGTNRSFDSWGGIKDNMRSAWNGGTSYRACVFRNKDYKSRVASLAVGQKHSWGGVQGAESNSWVKNTSCPL